jgi:hypothetical protein
MDKSSQYDHPGHERNLHAQTCSVIIVDVNHGKLPPTAYSTMYRCIRVFHQRQPADPSQCQSEVEGETNMQNSAAEAINFTLVLFHSRL